MPLYRKLPQRGFNRTRFQKDIAVVNVGELKKLTTSEVTLESLKKSGLVRSNAKIVKILGTGEIETSYTINVDYVSASACKKIEAVGGSVKRTN